MRISNTQNSLNVKLANRKVTKPQSAGRSIVTTLFYKNMAESGIRFIPNGFRCREAIVGTMRRVTCLVKLINEI